MKSPNEGVVDKPITNIPYCNTPVKGWFLVNRKVVGKRWVKNEIAPTERKAEHRKMELGQSEPWGLARS